MTTPVSTSLAGRIADAPRLQETSNGTVYVRVRVHVFPPRARHSDAAAHPPEPVTVELVAFDAVAAVLHQRFRFGDWFVASGRLDAGRNGVESFIARRIGHDATRVNYTLRRSGKRPSRSKPAEPVRQVGSPGLGEDSLAGDRSA